MKKLYVQYFINKESAVPWDSHFVCVDNCGTREMQESIAQNAYNMTVFLTQNPNGKAVFVWQ